MNYSLIRNFDIANGPGVRVSLFVSGCRNRCPGCFQPETWSFDYGKPFLRDDLKRLIEMLSPDYISGLTVLGGDPLEPENAWAVGIICAKVKEAYPDKSIWIYSGYPWEKVQGLKVMEYVDILVDGPFIESQKVLGEFRGSSNQRFIDVKKSLLSEEVYLYSL